MLKKRDSIKEIADKYKDKRLDLDQMKEKIEKLINPPELTPVISEAAPSELAEVEIKPKIIKVPLPKKAEMEEDLKR